MFFLIDVIALFIKYLKDELETFLKLNMRSYPDSGTDSTTRKVLTASDFQWVITVPTIWSPAAKQMMREAAYKVNTSFHVLSVCLFMIICITCLLLILTWYNNLQKFLFICCCTIIRQLNSSACKSACLLCDILIL